MLTMLKNRFTALASLTLMGMTNSLLAVEAMTLPDNLAHQEADNAEATEMVVTVAGSAANFANLIMGPGMYLIMAIGVVISLWGWAQGRKEQLFTGIGMFLIAALMKAIFDYI